MSAQLLLRRYRILQRRSTRLKASVSEMKEDVRRAKDRLNKVMKHADARENAASSGAAALSSLLDEARQARKAAAVESQKNWPTFAHVGKSATESYRGER